MLVENTGKHFLDSGGESDRHYQRNANKTLKDFKKEPAERYWSKGGYIYREVSTFHYLMNFGIKVTPLCEQFNKRNVGAGNWDADTEAYGVSKEAWSWLTDNYEVSVTRVFNTYNGDSDLSQVVQGAFLLINGNEYALIQIHGGSDVRGGYTDARLFKYDEFSGDFIPEWKSQSEIAEEINMGMIKLDDYGA